jgi:hypothetical protein
MPVPAPAASPARSAGFGVERQQEGTADAMGAWEARALMQIKTLWGEGSWSSAAGVGCCGTTRAAQAPYLLQLPPLHPPSTTTHLRRSCTQASPQTARPVAWAAAWTVAAAVAPANNLCPACRPPRPTSPEALAGWATPRRPAAAPAPSCAVGAAAAAGAAQALQWGATETRAGSRRRCTTPRTPDTLVHPRKAQGPWPLAPQGPSPLPASASAPAVAREAAAGAGAAPACHLWSRRRGRCLFHLPVQQHCCLRRPPAAPRQTRDSAHRRSLPLLQRPWCCGLRAAPPPGIVAAAHGRTGRIPTHRGRPCAIRGGRGCEAGVAVRGRRTSSTARKAGCKQGAATVARPQTLPDRAW